MSAAEQVSRLEVRVGNAPVVSGHLGRNALCFFDPSTVGRLTAWNMTCGTNGSGMRGRFVSVQRLTSGQEYLSLCEVRSLHNKTQEYYIAPVLAQRVSLPSQFSGLCI